MTVSGNTSYNPAVSKIIRGALLKCGAIAAGEQPSSDMTQDALDALNPMVKEWMGIGIHLWTTEEAILFLQPAQSRYVLKTGSTDHCCDAYSYVAPTLTVTAVAGATSLTVSSITSIADDDVFGVVLDSGTTFWTAVNGAPSGSTVVIDDALPSQATALAQCFDYATSAAIVRPLRVPAARRLQWNGSILTPMIRMSRSDYMDLPNPTDPGTPTQFYYSPQLAEGWFYIWQVTTNSASAVRFTYQRPIDDFSTLANTADFPQEWISTLIFNLAVEIAPEYGVPPAVFAQVKALADQKLQRMEGWDREPESVFFGVNTDQTRGN